MGELSAAVSSVAGTDEQRDARRAEPWRLDAAGAQLAAWAVLAFVNQLLIVARLPSARGAVRVLHHGYDAAQLLAMGVLSLGGVRLWQLGRARVPALSRLPSFASALALFVVAFGLSLLSVTPDIASFAQRMELEQWMVALPASLGFATLLASTLWLRARSSAALAFGLLGVGLALWLVNAFVLENDYFTAHFMLGWLAALLVGHALEGRVLPTASRRVRAALLVVLSVVALAGVLVPPRSEVQRRLYALSSSIVAPMTARFLPAQPDAKLTRVMPQYLGSPWFASRDQLPPVPPTRALAAQKPELVVLFTIDAVRADVLTTPKHRDRLPELSELMRTSTYFSQARSPTPATTTTFGSVFSGKYFSMLRWQPLGKGRLMLTEKTPRFAEVLANSGVHTIHIRTLGRLDAGKGVGLGFTAEKPIPRTKDGAKTVIDMAIDELNATPPGPKFLFAHFTEPHAPYDLGGKKGSPFNRYVAEIAIVDREIARFRAYLREKGLEQRTVLLVSSDHGEAFGEHGQHDHARSVYEELIHVPLLAYVPGQPARSVDTPVTLMDLGPTVLDLFDLAAPGSYMGQSLAPLLVGKPVELTRPIIADAGRRIQAFYFDDGRKVIFERMKKTVEVYDLHKDPEELTNLFDSDPAAVDAYVQTAEHFFSSVRINDGMSEATPNE